MAQPLAKSQPYRDFLTPSLHRRFTNAALLTFGVCYLYAIWMGLTDFFWSWFPVGPTGIRALFLFISILPVFILRVARMHVGSRTSTCEFETFRQYATRLSTIQVFLWYAFSGWFFSEVYIWSASTDVMLGMVDYGRSYERSRLNERPIILRTMFICLSIVQSFSHLYNDYDRVYLPSTESYSTVSEYSYGLRNGATKVLSQNNLWDIFMKQSLFRVFVVSIFGPIFYIIALRQRAWHFAFAIAKVVATLPKSSKPGRFPPDLAPMVIRFFVEGLLVAFLWGFANSAFDVFVSQAPLKKGLAITGDSKDPNGSLLAGLKAKKEIPKNCAFWELAIIVNHFPERRLTIFREIERPGGSTWSQILTTTMAEVHAVVKRIQDTQNPPSKGQSTANTEAYADQPTLPQLTAPLKRENVFQKVPPPASRVGTLEKNIGDFVKSHGQFPGADPISPRAKKLLAYGADALLSKEQQQELSKDKVAVRANRYIIEFLQSALGVPFRQTFHRRLLGVIVGTPHGSVGTMINAISSTSKLATCSLREDSFGKVSSDVPNIIRTFTSTYTIIENFIKSFEAHWTDVDFQEGTNGAGREVKEIEELLRALRNGLTSLVTVFGEYRDTLKLSQTEMRLAKEVIAKGP